MFIGLRLAPLKTTTAGLTTIINQVPIKGSRGRRNICSRLGAYGWDNYRR
ncbi:hypothetical protein ES708_12612 [subsurface metagenome]